MPLDRSDRKAVVLINHIKAHPLLYKSDHACFHALTRVEKQKLWDKIARSSGYSKTEDAKNKWRSLVVYLRQHLQNVDKKKIRRYIPNTGNPADKYVHEDDWRFYEYIKFMAPYVRTFPLARDVSKCMPKKIEEHATKQAAIELVSNTVAVTTQSIATINTAATITQSSPTPMQLKIGNVIVEVEVDGKTLVESAAPIAAEEVVSKAHTSTQLIATDALAAKPSITSISGFQELDTHEQNLIAFFDAMLRSTHSLPKFHQERVKRKLQNAIRIS